MAQDSERQVIVSIEATKQKTMVLPLVNGSLQVHFPIPLTSDDVDTVRAAFDLVIETMRKAYVEGNTLTEERKNDV